MSRSLVFFVAAIVLLPASARANILHVPGQYNTIQAALNAALTGDTVLVAAGTYPEYITWPNTQGIDLLSELGPDSTLIVGGDLGVICMDIPLDSTTVISGFLITNYLNLSPGIGCYNQAAPTIRGNIIRENAGDWGGGIRCYGSSPIIIDNIIRDNIATSITAPGGGILCYDSAAPAIINNIITNNTANYGGGICCLAYSSPTIIGNTITGNLAGVGGGIYCDAESSPEIIGNFIIDNISYYDGGGICCYGNSAPMIRNTTITGNSGNNGGGIRCRSYSSPTIDSCIIANNNGHGIYCSHSSSPLINYNNITDNTGYGVQNIDSSVIINAEYNWWGDASGPYHPGTNPGGLGDSVSDYVDFDPWLYWPGVTDRPPLYAHVKPNALAATIIAGQLQLPAGKECRVFDITGRLVTPQEIKPGIYFIEIDGTIARKVIKIR